MATIATASSSSPLPPLRILIINPNTSSSMTQALSPLLESLAYPSVQYTFFTSHAPGISSINSPSDAAESAKICLPQLLSLIPHHDAFLVACYSQHPLVGQLKKACAEVTKSATKGAGGSGARKYVTGIFEASVLASLGLLRNEDPEGSEGESGGDGEAFGIVSTGKIWETALQEAVEGFLGLPQALLSRRFAGVETTGLNATDLHDLPGEEVRKKMMEATKRLLQKGAGVGSEKDSTAASPGSSVTARVKAICLGCAGMAGLDDAVRQACIEELGEEKGKEVHVVDGVKAGVGVLVGLARAGF